MFARPLESDHDRILSFVLRDPLGWVDRTTYRRYLASGSYGADRIWLAEDNGRIAAALSGTVRRRTPIHSSSTVSGSILDVGDRVALGAAVLQAGHAALRDRNAALQLSLSTTFS